MKKAITLVLTLVLCLSMLSVAAFAAGDYYCIAGTMNGWNANSADRLTDNGDGTYSITFTNMAPATYEFKFTKNGGWDACFGGAFMGSGLESDLVSPGSNICFTLEEASDVVIVMNLNTNKFTVTIGGKVDAPVGNIKVHVSVPAGWGDVYVYVWDPEHLGSWSGTKLEGNYIEIPASFGGMVINNGNGRQSSDIKDIDLTKEEVWIVINEFNGYTLHYTEPEEGGETPEVSTIKVHVIAPQTWTEVYAYTFYPQHLGNWPGTLVENGVIELANVFEGLIFHNNAGVQTADIKDIDLTKEEVWVTVNEYGAYALSYTEPEQGGENVDPSPEIKIHVIAENWDKVYAYTYNPELTGTWPGTLVENGCFETLGCFGGLVLNNGEGQQTWDITDIDLTKGEVWITVGDVDEFGKCAYTLSYEAPNGNVQPNTPPATGDDVVVMAVVMMMAATGVVVLMSKKKHF